MIRHRTEIGQRFGKATPIVTVGANEHVDVPRDVFDGAVKESRRAADDDVGDVMRSESVDDPIKVEWGGLWRRHAAELRRNVRCHLRTKAYATGTRRFSFAVSAIRRGAKCRAQLVLTGTKVAKPADQVRLRQGM